MRSSLDAALTEAQLTQRSEARKKAVISRRLKQLKRIEQERREVIWKLAQAGVKIDGRAVDTTNQVEQHDRESQFPEERAQTQLQ